MTPKKKIGQQWVDKSPWFWRSSFSYVFLVFHVFPIFHIFLEVFACFHEKNRKNIRKKREKCRWPKRNPKCCWKNLETWKIAKTSRKLGTKSEKKLKKWKNVGKIGRNRAPKPRVLSTRCFSYFLGGQSSFFSYFLLIWLFPWFPRGAWNRQT